MTIAKSLRWLLWMLLAASAVVAVYAAVVPGHYVAVARFTSAEPPLDADATAAARHAVGAAAVDLRLRPIGTGLVEVRAYTRDARAATTLADAYAGAYVTAARGQLKAESDGAAALVQDRRADLQSRRTALEARAVAIEREANGAVALQVMEQDVARHLRQAQRRRNSLAAPMAQIERTADLTSIPFVAADPMVRSLLDDLQIIEAARDGSRASAAVTASYEAALAEGRAQLRALATQLVAATRADFDRATIDVRVLESEQDSLRRELALFDAKRAEARRLRAEAASLGTPQRQVLADSAPRIDQWPSVVVYARQTPPPTRRALRLLEWLAGSAVFVSATVLAVGWYRRGHRLAHHAAVAMRVYQRWRPGPVP